MRNSKNSKRFYQYRRKNKDIAQKVRRDVEEQLPKIYHLPEDVTEHALLRYLLRIKKLDIPSFVRELQELAKPLIEIGDGKYKVGDSMLVIKNKKIVTVIGR